ncbi:TrbC/VirB2 family protein [Treponema zuelzerae]|uniref:TrbC/VirB2 family protein n=1 Tax=Teretinema zuelzerae TaxID=156 RepID=A0AAE3EFA1_9SPIR|nr:TrbC/VirB2 family protein [Teretinema zuelzerae]MCD1653529.1 TrbC/VirB2 family protein [Teretinema zuelzerae]
MMNEKRLERKHMILCQIAFLLVLGAGLYASTVVIPDEVQTTLEEVRNAFTGDLARILVGIFFAGSCIAYAYNKDNEKMKAKMIAVMIGSGLLALSQSIVDNVMKMGS